MKSINILGNQISINFFNDFLEMCKKNQHSQFFIHIKKHPKMLNQILYQINVKIIINPLLMKPNAN